MLIKDFSLKKKYSHIRFGYEISALLFIIFLITCFDRKINALELILFLSSLIFLIFSLFKFNILIKIQFIFNKFFFLISKIINPILMVIVYFISIIPMALLFKIINNHNADTKVGFSANGVAGSNYFTVKQSTTTEPMEIKVTELHFSVTNSAIEVVAGLTGIATENINNNWSGSAGVG